MNDNDRSGVNDRKMHLANLDVGHVADVEAILLSEPHPDWAEGRTIDLFAWDGELVAHIEFEDAKAADAAAGPLRMAMARAIRLVFPAEGAECQPVPEARYNVTQRPRASAVYSDRPGAHAFDLVDDYRDIAATVGFETEGDALLARGTVALILGTARSVLSGADFMAQENDVGGPFEVSGDHSRCAADSPTHIPGAISCGSTG